MTENDKLTLLKAELNMMNPPQERVTFLQQLLGVAASRIRHRGMTLSDDVPGDVHLQVEYAAWLYRRRMQQASAQMPEYLRLDLNDRLASEKMRESGDA